MEEITDVELVKKEIETKNEEELKPSPPLNCNKGRHSFTTDGMEMGLVRIKCSRCPVGYFLSEGHTLKDGHVYIGKQFVV